MLILGAGGHGKVVADAATERWRSIAFVDHRFPDHFPGGARVGAWPVVGHPTDLATFTETYPSLVVAIGDNIRRLEWVDTAVRLGFHIPNIIHPSARSPIDGPSTSPSGSVIFAKATVAPSASIARGCIINTAAAIDAGVRLGAGVHVSPGATVGAGSEIGDRCWIGIGATIAPGLRLAPGTIVGAGARVTNSPGYRCLLLGVPAMPHPAP